MSIAISDGTNTITFAPDGPYRLTVDNLAIVANGGARILRVIPRTTANPFVEQLISGELQWTLHVKVWVPTRTTWPRTSRTSPPS